jgi:hypothetical protein
MPPSRKTPDQARRDFFRSKYLADHNSRNRPPGSAQSPGQDPVAGFGTAQRDRARKKYKRLASIKRAKSWWTAVTKRDPGLFAHWRWTVGF